MGRPGYARIAAADGEVEIGRSSGSAAYFVRWEYYPQNFLGFVQLAFLVILFRRF
jgi:hypothetical protein